MAAATLLSQQFPDRTKNKEPITNSLTVSFYQVSIRVHSTANFAEHLFIVVNKQSNASIQIRHNSIFLTIIIYINESNCFIIIIVSNINHRNLHIKIYSKLHGNFFFCKIMH